VAPAAGARASAAPLSLPEEIRAGLLQNWKAYGSANAYAAASTVMGAALRFVLDAHGPAVARRTLVDIGEALEASIKFAAIEKEGTRQ
jgi:hypothetical protein